VVDEDKDEDAGHVRDVEQGAEEREAGRAGGEPGGPAALEEQEEEGEQQEEEEEGGGQQVPHGALHWPAR
jgi:hypothetical protein